MRRTIIACVLLFVLVALPSGAGASGPGLRIGFNVNGPTDQDLAALNASGTAGVFANFATPLDLSQDRPGLLNVRILRHTDGCPGSFGYACSYPTASDLAAFAAAHPGMTYELGNEIGTPGQDGRKGVVAWAKLGYSTITNADPTATVLGPGMVNFGSDAVSIYDKLGGSYSAVAVHLYPPNLCLSSSWLNQVKSTVDSAMAYAAAHGKSTYMTEMSDVPSCSGSAANRTYYISAIKAYMAGKGIVAAIFFLERPSPDYNTGFLFDQSGLRSSEGDGWAN